MYEMLWLGPLIVGGLATWRLTRLLVVEEGPFKIFYKLRTATGIEYDIDNDTDEVFVSWHPSWNPLYCEWCTSLWVAILMYILWLHYKPAVFVLALSGVSCLLHVISERVENDGQSRD